ncbi:MAG: DUF998 domain-containing protein [Actinomycetales bacterium]|nr:DUF998 domain-containing protein [Actinomycetales bacterium]
MSGRLAALLGAALALAALAAIWSLRLSVAQEVYVSELGAVGMPTAGAFQVALLLLVAGALLIAFAGRSLRSRARILRAWAPSVTLAVSAGFFLLAAQVPCTLGCPMPYGPRFTWPDFVHTTAATLAFAAAAWGMLQLAFAVGHRAMRRFSAIAAVLVAAVSAAGGLLSLFSVPTRLGGSLEIVATTVGLAWIACLGLALGLGSSAPHDADRVAAHRDEELVGQGD